MLGYAQPVAAKRRRGLSYKGAGVDIDAADRLVGRISRIARATHGPEVLSGVGPFAAAIRIPPSFKTPVLVASADGVGTKLDIARLAGQHETVGIDLVAMNVNDLLTCGARPLFFLDYLSTGKLADIDAVALVEGMAEGCRQAGASLVGGETAEMPGFYPAGVYDLAGFSVGVAERRRLIDGRRVRAGDAVVGLHASGLHSNGFSLARKALGASTRASLKRRPAGLGRSLGEELMSPTRIYVRPVLAALDRFRIKAMAHITGGGLPGNLPRVLPKGVGAVIERDSLPKLAVLELVQTEGRVTQGEMDRTFNCGIGYTIVVPAGQAGDLCTFMRRRRVPASVIGRIVAGPRRVRYA